MVRMQIQLTDEQAKKVREAAAVLGLSMVEFVCRAINDEISRIDRASAKKRALRAIGCVRSGVGDLSVEHDKYLLEAYLR